MITSNEIGSLMKACNQPTLRVEILQIVAAAKEPICCQDMYKKSSNAPDSMTLSREVHLMTATAGLLEVAEKKPREGFREVSFYRLTEAGRQQLDAPATEQVQPSAAKVQPNTSIPPTPFIKENTMSQKQTQDRTGKLRAFILDLITKQPGISKASITEYAEVEHPDAGDRIRQTIGNLVTGGHIKGEGKRGSLAYSATGSGTKPASATGSGTKPASAPPQAQAASSKPKRAATATKPAKPKASHPAPVAAAHPAAFDPEYSFAFGVRKDGGVAICKDGISVVLARSEVQTILAHTTQEQ